MQIPRIDAPSRDEFSRQYLLPGRPVVMTGLVQQWPSWGEWNLDWFESRYGHLALSGNNSLQGTRSVQVGQYLQSLRERSGDGLYLDAMPLAWLPGMRESMVLPPYMPTDRKTEVLVWVGPEGTCLNFHKDNHSPLDGNQNLLCQLLGRKRVVLVGPEHDEKMYPEAQLPNDYLRSRVRLDQPDPDAFPLFEQVQLWETEVGPGDTLFIPAHWWHYVRSLEISMTVTFWWRSSLLIELLGQFREAARDGSLEAFLNQHQGSVGLAEVREVGGPGGLDQLWQPMSARVRQLCGRLLSPEVRALVSA
ncbi:MAG: cupin-like domain-containing protein [Candidatus Eremiobacteraeota bacterium]|nr:cupin-like domain-containing protein [Candidatus Eremiobacteraeota bacterium]MCW5867060.1 cupin-like domain-containing protein [Candidatus Eremiobacteraeota bacterium]